MRQILLILLLSSLAPSHHLICSDPGAATSATGVPASQPPHGQPASEQSPAAALIEELTDDKELTPLQKGILTQDEGNILAKIASSSPEELNEISNSEMNPGTTALHIAALLGQEKTVQALLDKGANPCIAPTEGSYSGATPSFCAARHGYKGTLRLLLDAEKTGQQLNGNYTYQRGMVNINHNKGTTLYHTAVEAGQIEIIEMLVHEYKDIPLTTRPGSGKYYTHTPLTLAQRRLARAVNQNDESKKSTYISIIKLLEEAERAATHRDAAVVQRVLETPPPYQGASIVPAEGIIAPSVFNGSATGKRRRNVPPPSQRVLRPRFGTKPHPW